MMDLLQLKYFLLVQQRVRRSLSEVNLLYDDIQSENK